MQTQLKLAALGLLVGVLATGCAPNPGAQSTTNGYNGSSVNTSANSNYNSQANPQTNYNYDYNANSNSANPPASSNTYDYSSGNSAANNTNPMPSMNDQYNAYNNNNSNSSSGSSGSSNYYDYSGSSNSSGSSYSGSNSYSAGSAYSGASSGSASGSFAIQVLASGNRNTANSMQQQMQGQGFNAVVDSVGGLYKVRIPYTSRGDAQSNLSRVRGSVPDAFLTTR